MERPTLDQKSTRCGQQCQTLKAAILVQYCSNPSAFNLKATDKGTFWAVKGLGYRDKAKKDSPVANLGPLVPLMTKKDEQRRPF